MQKSRFLAPALAALMLGLAAPAAAGVIDPAGDFLDTYTGPENGDLDLLSAEAAFLGGGVSLTTTANGDVGGTAGAFYAWGVNRGAGTAGLFQSTMPQIGAGVLHDAVVILRPNLTGTVVQVGPMGALTFLNLAPGSVTVSGDTIRGVVPFSLLPSTGFDTDDYLYTAWTRSGMGPNNLVADFAPENAPFRAVPEPGVWALMILGFGLAGSALRRRRAALA